MKDLEDYVPKKLKKYLFDCYRDSDGIWYVFHAYDGKKPRFDSTDASGVHEDTIKQCREAMRNYTLQSV